MLVRRELAGVSFLCNSESWSGTPRVLLHGIGSNAESFAALMACLAPEQSLLAWDAPGYGCSQPLGTECPTASDYADALVQLLDRLGVGTCELLGHSLGAIVAGRLAALHPRRVSRLVLVSPALGYGTKQGAPLAPQVAQRLDALKQEGAAAFAKARATRLVYRHDERLAVLAAVEAAMSRVTLAGYSGAAHLLSTADLVGEASAIEARTLILVGAEDEVTPVSNCRRLHDALVAARPSAGHRFHVVPDAGHAVCQERPDVVAKLFEATVPTMANTGGR